MPVGQYYDFDIHPTCGLASPTNLIGLLDNPGPTRIAAREKHHWSLERLFKPFLWLLAAARSLRFARFCSVLAGKPLWATFQPARYNGIAKRSRRW